MKSIPWYGEYITTAKMIFHENLFLTEIECFVFIFDNAFRVIASWVTTILAQTSIVSS